MQSLFKSNCFVINMNGAGRPGDTQFETRLNFNRVRVISANPAFKEQAAT